MRRLTRLLSAIIVALLVCPVAHAEVVVVMSVKSEVSALSRDEVINIFMGRYRQLPSGVAAVPIDQPATEGLRATFYRRLVDKDVSEINAYWARLYFSGKTSPPVQPATSGEALALILKTPGGIGYLERQQADARFRVVLSLAP